MSSTTEPTSTTIEDLPSEMISELFEHLPLKDLAACSLVNKHWHSIYTSFKLHRLAAISSCRSSRFLRMGNNSDQPFQKAEECHPTMFLRLVEKPLLSNLTQLALCNNKLEFDLNKLNRFQQLEHLEIDCIPFKQMKVHLNLPRLTVLAIHCWPNWILSIDCPRLSTLLYVGDNEIASLLKVKHPETIRKLETRIFGAKLIQFKSVECLVTENFKAISKDTLLSLPELRELHYNKSIQGFFTEEARKGPGTVDRMKQKLNEFLGKTKKLKGSDFRFTFSGFQLTNVNVDQIDFGVQVNASSGKEYVRNEYVYMKNYHLIEPGAIDFVHNVDYIRLLNHMTGEFPRCFSQKFTGIEWVAIWAKVQNPDHLLWFLKPLRSLRQLSLEKTGLGQEFYDQLPASAPSLIILELRTGHCEKGLQLNFDFLDRLSRLSELGLWPVLSLESLPSFVRSIGRLKEGYFGVRPRDQLFSLGKRDSSAEWWIESDEKILFQTENPEKVVNFFEGLLNDMPESSSSSD